MITLITVSFLPPVRFALITLTATCCGLCKSKTALPIHTRLTSMTLESFSQSHFQISPNPPYADGYLYRFNSSPVRSAVERVRYLSLCHSLRYIWGMHCNINVRRSQPGDMTPCDVLVIVHSRGKYVLPATRKKTEVSIVGLLSCDCTHVQWLSLASWTRGSPGRTRHPRKHVL